MFRSTQEGLSLKLNRDLAAGLLLAMVLCFAPSAYAADTVEKIETVDRVDLVNKTMLLAGRTYHVTENTRILDTNGVSMRLRDLKATDGKRYAPEAHQIKFTARRSGPSSNWELKTVTVLGYDEDD